MAATSPQSDDPRPTPSPASQGPPDPAPLPDPDPARRPLSYRSRHRARQHDLAHAPEHAAAEPTLPDDPLIPRGEPALIATPAALAELIAHLRAAGAFAYDSEFIGEESYVPRICLIQVATASRVALIDPLRGLDLRPFWELLADPGVEKIVHAGQQDFEPVVRFLARGPANIVDVQLASAFAGVTYPIALWKLVQEFVGVELGKAPKFSQWDRRPLTPVQLRYAANDVRFLVSLRARLGERLVEMGNLAWALEECAAMSDPALYRFDLDQQCVRLRGAERLKRRELALLRSLLLLRDQMARQLDVPPRTFLKDGVLLDLARNPIASVEDLAQVWGLPRPVELAHGQTILDLTLRAKELPQNQLPETVRNDLTYGEHEALEEVAAILQVRCAQRRIDPAVVASRAELSRFIRRLSRGKGPGDARLGRGWRQAFLGDAIADALAALAERRKSRRPTPAAPAPPDPHAPPPDEDDPQP